MQTGKCEVIHQGERLTVMRSEAHGRAVWHFAGEASARVKGLRDILDSLAERVSSEENQVLIDLKDMGYVSSPFIGFLVRLIARLADKDMVLELWGPSERVLDLLGIMGIADAFRIVPADRIPDDA